MVGPSFEGSALHGKGSCMSPQLVGWITTVSFLLALTKMFLVLYYGARIFDITIHWFPTQPRKHIVNQEMLPFGCAYAQASLSITGIADRHGMSLFSHGKLLPPA